MTTKKTSFNRDGASIPQLQRIIEKGALVPGLQSIPAQPSPPTAPSSGGNNSNPNTSGQSSTNTNSQ